MDPAKAAFCQVERGCVRCQALVEEFLVTLKVGESVSGQGDIGVVAIRIELVVHRDRFTHDGLSFRCLTEQSKVVAEVVQPCREESVWRFEYFSAEPK